MYDLSFGDFGDVELGTFKQRLPVLVGYFPLHAFKEEYRFVQSLGPDPIVMRPVKDFLYGFFEWTPVSLLIHPRLPGWASEFLGLEPDLPFACALSAFKFDLVSSVKVSSAVNIREAFTLLTFHTLNLPKNFVATLDVEFDLTLGSASPVFEGSATFTLLVDSVVMQTKAIPVTRASATSDFGTLVNFAGLRDPHLTQRQLDKGYYQALSLQSVFFRVRVLVTAGAFRTRHRNGRVPSQPQRLE